MNYYLLNPTGNRTILADARRNPTCTENFPEMAARLMERELSAEQVGFLLRTDPDCDISLTMAGGEFCGNAAMSAAAVYVFENKKTEESTVTVKMSGTERPVSVQIRKDSELQYTGSIRMPGTVAISNRNFCLDGKEYTFPTVSFQGITHLICNLDSGDSLPKKADLERAVPLWCGELNANALGIMQISMKNGTLVPLVYVKTAETLFWESSCASGTSAVGAYLAEYFGKPVDLSFQEPAGELRIQADPKGKIILTGKVSIEKIIGC